MNLKARLAAGEPLLGTFLKTPHPHVVEVLARSGFDLLCIDAEHAPFDRREIDLCVMAARAGQLPVLVRTQTAAPEAILNVLDCGADGVLVPHVRSATAARAMLAVAHYGPGGRGYSGSTRAAGYGLTAMTDHRDASIAGTVVVAQIEDADALDSIETIAEIDGIDALFIGRTDLAVALGCTSPDDSQVVAACERITAAGVAAGRRTGIFLSRAEEVSKWRERGVTLFLLGSDHGILRSGAAELRRVTGI